jgi:hypothetical protein
LEKYVKCKFGPVRGQVRRYFFYIYKKLVLRQFAESQRAECKRADHQLIYNALGSITAEK